MASVTTNNSTKRARQVLYQDLTSTLLEDIRQGTFPLGSKLPSQAELVDKYGVSVTTVRLALANLQRRGIIRKEHGRGSYVSLQSGDNHRSETLRNVGLIFEKTGRPEDAPAESETVLAFHRVVTRSGKRLVTMETSFDQHAGWGELVSAFDGMPLDGVCVFLHEPADAADRIGVLGREFPSSVVMFPGPSLGAMPVDCIDVDVRAGVEQLMSNLIQLGHRRVAYVGSHIEACLSGDPNVTAGRWQAYRDAMEEIGAGVDRSLVVEVPYGKEPDLSVADQIIEMLRGDNPVTAIVAVNDWMARSLMNLLWQKGVQIPRDVSLAGFDDLSYARELVPGLTTVAFPFEKMAERAVDLLENRFAHPDVPLQQVTLPTRLVLRDTVVAISSDSGVYSAK